MEGPLGKSRALASDPATNRIFEIEDRGLGRTTVGLRISTVGTDGKITQGSLRSVVDNNGIDIRFIRSLAFGNGTLYAASSGNVRRNVPGSIGTIDLQTFVYTTLSTSSQSPGASAMTFDHDRDELLLGVLGNPNEVFSFDPDTGESERVLEMPASEGSFDGMAYGFDRIWFDCGSSNACGNISVFNRTTGQFEAPLDTPNRFGNGSGGAAFLEALAVPAPPPLDRSVEVFAAFRNRVNVPGVGSVNDEDIVSYDVGSDTWSLEFDGSDVGLGSLKISGLAILDDGDILLSFRAPGVVPGLIDGPSGEQVDDSDIVRFVPTSLGTNTAGTFEFFFDGSDVGLTENSEDIDAIAVADNGQLIVSTVGRFRGTGANGADEDLFRFSSGFLGSETIGSFELFFDGSDVGFGGNSATDVDAFALTATGSLLLSILKDATISGLVVSDEDVLDLEFSPTALGPTTSGTLNLFLELSEIGIDGSEDVGALFVAD